MKQILSLIVLAFFAISCSVTSQSSKSPNLKRAQELAQQFIIVDTHVDLPDRLYSILPKSGQELADMAYQSKEGDTDFVRGKKGGLDAPFMSIYIPSSKTPPEARAYADTLIDIVEYLAQYRSQNFEIAFTPADVERAFRAGKMALPMGMENGSPIMKISDVKYFRDRGISYVTLTHAEDNDISDSSYDESGTWGGLSEYGRDVVREMNRVGIMVDISHVSDAAFYDAVAVSAVPVIASHSSARRFTPGWERNMSDEMMHTLKKNGGVIQVTFGSSFLDSEVVEYRSQVRNKFLNQFREQGLSGYELQMAANNAAAKDPKTFSTISKIADHIDHIVNVIGIDYVGLGSDFDGVGDSLPEGMKDVSGFPNLIAELLDRGYSEEDVEKICYKNIFRVWNQVLDYAAAQ